MDVNTFPFLNQCLMLVTIQRYKDLFSLFLVLINLIVKNYELTRQKTTKMSKKMFNKVINFDTQLNVIKSQRKVFWVVFVQAENQSKKDVNRKCVMYRVKLPLISNGGRNRKIALKSVVIFPKWLVWMCKYFAHELSEHKCNFT